MPMSSWGWVKFHHCADANNWYWDSAAWMKVALREDMEGRRVPMKSGPYTDHNRLNVALVSAGISLELIYKVLLIADRVETKPTHSLRRLHGLLEDSKNQVEEILIQEGWPSVEAFLNFVDDDLKHWDRKYWMSNPPNRGGVNFAIADGLLTVPSLARIYEKLATLVDIRKLTEEYNLEHARVVTTQALTEKPVVGHMAVATKNLALDGRKATYTVYESSWYLPDYLRGWWEMPTESGQPSGEFVFLLKRGEYDSSLDYWPKEP